MKGEEFKYADVRFADVQLLRYQVPGFASLSLRQRTLVYYLSEAALAGRDILWHQNCRYNLPIRLMLETVFLTYKGDRQCADFRALHTYLRRIWFANGIHHHYSMEKFRPEFSEAFLRQALHDTGYPVDEELMKVIFDPTLMARRVNQAEGEDLLVTSAMNYYAPGITQQEAEQFYKAQKRPDDPCPPMYGMNSRLERDGDGRLVERVWRSGGLYGAAIDRIMGWLQRAEEVAEDDDQREVIRSLAQFYKTGNLYDFDRYCIRWVEQTGGDVDFTNGFTEVYGDPLGLKASWEGYVNFRDAEATERTERLSRNAQWFEDHSPVDPRFRKRECRGVTARVVTVAMLGGDLYPASAIGINLPNSNWIRQTYGSKSVTLGNLTHAYAEVARGNGFLEEFVIPEELEAQRLPVSDRLDDLHTDLHECLGHGSGQLLPGVDPDSLGSYGSTIEEARADLFALYYMADPKLVELGLVPDAEAYKIQYYSYLMNGLVTQLARIEPGCEIEEAHMRNRALIARWVMAHSGGAMGLEQRDGKTYLRIRDYAALRPALGQLLAEVQRIKSEGDRIAASRLVDEYGVHVDAALHDEVLRRYRALGLAPYKGFINPQFHVTCDAAGRVKDVEVTYGESYDDQMLRYSREYSTLLASPRGSEE